MSRFTKGLAVASATAAVGIGVLLISKPNMTIDIPEANVQAEIAAKLPIDVDQGGVKITVTGAEVDFLDTNAAHIIADIDYAGYGISGSAIADVTSSLSYVDGNFFLADLKLDDVRIALNDDSAQVVEDAKSVSGGLFDRARAAVSKSEAKAGAALDRFRDAGIETVRPKLQDGLERAMRGVPVYSLNDRDLKHSMAAAALEDVTFTADAVRVSLNPAQLLMKVLAGAAVLAAAGFLAIGILLGGGRGAVSIVGGGVFGG